MQWLRVSGDEVCEIEMIALLQRVSYGSVRIEGNIVAEIGSGVLVLVAIQPDDDERCVIRMGERILGYRMFSDNEGKMNLSVMDIGGEVLLVPQFTLAAETGKGMRPSFTRAAKPETARSLFEHLYTNMLSLYPKLSCGRFGATMQVKLVNEGPVTFMLQTR